MTGQALIVQGDALHLPLPDASVDMICTSPPFWALRAYGAGPGEIGSEPTPAEYLEALWAATAEMMRVLKPTGSAFVDLGDKYSERTGGKHHSSDGYVGRGHQAGTAQQSRGPREKSLLLLPERYRVGCVDRLGLIARAVICWSKPNSLPESVVDRVRRSHEDWVHLVKQPRYYSALDEVREVHTGNAHASGNGSSRRWADSHHERGERGHRAMATDPEGYNPLGKLPGSVWTIPSEPLSLPGYFVLEDGQLRDFLPPGRGGPRPRRNGNGHGLFDLDAYSELIAAGDGPAWRWLRATGVNVSPWPRDDRALQLRTAASHYAAFPSRWPEQLIKGFSPPGICLDCGQGRVPVVEREPSDWEARKAAGEPMRQAPIGNQWAHLPHGAAANGVGNFQTRTATILGYACSCTPFTDHPGSGESAGVGQIGRADNPGRYPNTGEGWEPSPSGKGGLGDRPKVGPWREYYLDGWKAPPTRPSVVLDPFSGVGTTVGVARQLGRIGIGVDLSHPYCRAAKWRVFDSGSFTKAQARTWADRQGVLL